MSTSGVVSAHPPRLRRPQQNVGFSHSPLRGRRENPSFTKQVCGSLYWPVATFTFGNMMLVSLLVLFKAHSTCVPFVFVS
eukprot:7017467-Heterocapsa_arctica.AAC.1